MKDTAKIPPHDKPMAAPGLTSYRYRHGKGYVMIGATSQGRALIEAQRSIGDIPEESNLEVWNGSKYEPVTAP